MGFNAAKDFLKDNEYMPRISFVDGQEHTVELGKAKRDIIAKDGENIDGIKFLVKEDGEAKTFFTSSVSLVDKLSGYNSGDVVKIKMRKYKNPEGQFRATYEVALVNKADGTVEEEEIDEEVEEEIDEKPEEEKPKKKTAKKESTEEIRLEDIPF